MRRARWPDQRHTPDARSQPTHLRPHTASLHSRGQLAAHGHERTLHTAAEYLAWSARASPDRALALSLGADHESRLVDEVDDRQAELVAGVDEARELLGRRRGKAAAVVARIGGEHADRPALEARERRDQRAAVAAA